MKEKTGFWSLSQKVSPLEILFFLLLIFLPTQFGKHFWPNFSFVNGIRIDYLSPTLYLTDLIILLFILTYFILSKGKLSKLKFLILLIPFAIGFFASNNQPAFIFGFIKLVEFYLLGLIVADKFSLSKKIIKILSFTVLFESLLSIAQFIGQGSIGSLFYFLGERTFVGQTPGIANASINGSLVLRPYGTFSHPNALAGFLAVILIMIFLNFKNIKKSEKLFYYLTLLLGSIALILSMGRAAILVWVAVLLIETYKKIKDKRKLFILIIVFSLFVLAGSSNLNRFNSLSLTEESFIQRVDLSKSALSIFSTSPLLGVGLNNFFYLLPKYSNSQVLLIQPPHNIFLLVLVQFGLVGFFTFLFFLFYAFKKILNKVKNENRQILLYCFFAILFLGFFDHYLLTLQQGQILFSLILAFSLSKN